MTYAVLFNGPPGSGKDHAGRVLSRRLRCHVLLSGFARVVKDQVHRAYGIAVQHDAFEAVKDTPHPLFLNVPPRLAYISFAEEFRRLHGKDVYGRLLLQGLQRVPDVLAITDCGFVEEAQPILARFGPKNCLLIRLQRDGHDFTGDSRAYVELACSTVDLHNRGDESFERDVLDAVRAILPVEWR